MYTTAVSRFNITVPVERVSVCFVVCYPTFNNNNNFLGFLGREHTTICSTKHVTATKNNLLETRDETTVCLGGEGGSCHDS